jgi:hypothetical protein
MDLSALDKALATIESQIFGIEQYVDSLEKWLWLSSLAVIIGVALEVYFVVNQYREEREAWGRGFVRPPDRPSPWLLAVEVASIILVVAGIVGELGIGILSSNSNAKLRTLNNSRLDLVRQQATDAATQAGDAKQSATQARDAAASAVSSAASARKEADSFEARIKSATETAIAAEAHLAEALREVQVLQAAAAWREFPRADSDKLVALTRQRFSGTLPVTVSFSSVIGNPEALRYGQLLSTALSTGLATPIAPPNGLSTCLECTGVWVVVNVNATSIAASDARIIRDLLELAGVKGSKFSTDPNNGQGAANNIMIIVGPKE